VWGRRGKRKAEVRERELSGAGRRRATKDTSFVDHHNHLVRLALSYFYSPRNFAPATIDAISREMSRVSL
jgi:hypothetical protein